jgi:hypothetical protein
MLTLQELLLEHNTFVPLMKQTYETLYEQQILGNDDLDLIMHLHFQLGKETQCYNLLETNEITLVLQGDGDVPNALCNIVIRLHGSLLQHINECHLTYLSLHYVLLFLYSELN